MQGLLILARTPSRDLVQVTFRMRVFLARNILILSNYTTKLHSDLLHRQGCSIVSNKLTYHPWILGRALIVENRVDSKVHGMGSYYGHPDWPCTGYRQKPVAGFVQNR